MAKEKKKSPKDASKTFHDIMKASVNPPLDKHQLLKIEQYLKSGDQEEVNLGSNLSRKIPNKEKKNMLVRLGGSYKIEENQIIKIK